MAIRPEEILTKLDAEDRATLAALEQEVDRAIKSTFDGSRPVSVDLLNNRGTKIRPSVKTKLREIYEKAGWSAKIEEGDSQRDGAWCNLVLASKPDRSKCEHCGHPRNSATCQKSHP